MSGKSNYLEDLILNWECNGQAMPSPPTSYVALFNGDPLDTGLGGTEVTTTIRAAGRVAASFGAITTAAGANSISNDADVDFGPADGDATFSHFATFDAASAGNMLRSGSLADGEQSVSAGTRVKFESGALVFSES